MSRRACSTTDGARGVARGSPRAPGLSRSMTSPPMTCSAGLFSSSRAWVACVRLLAVTRAEDHQVLVRDPSEGHARARPAHGHPPASEMNSAANSTTGNRRARLRELRVHRRRHRPPAATTGPATADGCVGQEARARAPVTRAALEAATACSLGRPTPRRALPGTACGTRRDRNGSASGGSGRPVLGHRPQRTVTAARARPRRVPAARRPGRGGRRSARRPHQMFPAPGV